MIRIANARDSRLAIKMSCIEGQWFTSKRPKFQPIEQRRQVLTSPCCHADLETMRVGLNYCDKCKQEYLMNGSRVAARVGREA